MDICSEILLFPSLLPVWCHLLNSNELCAIKNGEIQLISMPFESVLRYCGRKYPGYLVGMIHVVEQSGNKLYLVLVFIFVFYMETNHLRLATWIWAKYLQWIFSMVLYFRQKNFQLQAVFQKQIYSRLSGRLLACQILQSALLWGWLGSEFIAFYSKPECCNLFPGARRQNSNENVVSGDGCLVHRPSSLVWPPCWAGGWVTSEQVLMLVTEDSMCSDSSLLLAVLPSASSRLVSASSRLV